MLKTDAILIYIDQRLNHLSCLAENLEKRVKSKKYREIERIDMYFGMKMYQAIFQEFQALKDLIKNGEIKK